jgi:hypothetical protein
MSNTYGHVQRITRQVGDKLITFRSKLEYRYAVWLQLQKELGFIQNWWYESEALELRTRIFNNKKIYLPDFIVLNNEDVYELHETKGFFSQKDKSKMKLAAEQYENPIVLIFDNMPESSRVKSKREQIERVENLKPFLKRVIYNANRDIFSKIKHLFQV